MDEKKLTIDQELEDMKKQFEVLKERFERQEIVTDRLMRNTIRRKISTYNWISLYIPVIILIPAVIGLFGLAERLQLPIWPCFVGTVLFGGCVLAEYYMRAKYRSAFCLDEDIRKAVHSAKEYRMKETRLIIGVSILMLLFVGISYYSWFSAIAESKYIGLTSDPVRWVMFVLSISAIIGICSYVSIKSLRIFDSIIKDLEE